MFLTLRVRFRVYRLGSNPTKGGGAIRDAGAREEARAMEGGAVAPPKGVIGAGRELYARNAWREFVEREIAPQGLSPPTIVDAQLAWRSLRREERD